MKKRLSISESPTCLRTPEARVKDVATKIEAGLKASFSSLTRIEDFEGAFKSAIADTQRRIDDRRERSSSRPRLTARCTQIAEMQAKIASDSSIEFLGFVGFNDSCAVKFLPGQDISEYHGALLRRGGQIVLETFGSAYVHEIGLKFSAILKDKDTQVFKHEIDTSTFSAYAIAKPSLPLTGEGRVTIIEENGEIDVGVYSLKTNGVARLVVQAPVTQTQVLKLYGGPDDLEDYKDRFASFLKEKNLRFGQIEWGEDTDNTECLRVVLVGKRQRPDLATEFQALFSTATKITSFYPAEVIKIGGVMCNAMCPKKIQFALPEQPIMAESIYSPFTVSVNKRGAECNQIGLLYVLGKLDNPAFSDKLSGAHKEKWVVG